MPQKSLITRIGNSIASGLGYTPLVEVEKKTTDLDAKYKAIALNNGSRFGLTPENLMAGLRKPSKISFRILREIAKRDSLCRICINIVKKAVSQAEWDIVVKETAPKPPEYYKDKKQKIYDLFEFLNPNGENLRELVDRVAEDVLILDAGAIEKQRTMDGKIIGGLNSVDAATIRPVYNIHGELGDPAYKQYVNNEVVAEFKQTELVYLMANPQNDVESFGYGMSPIESILLQVQASLEAEMYNIKTFSKDNIPPGMLDLGDMTGEEAEQFIAVWNATVIGNTQGMKFVWGSDNQKKYTPFIANNKDMQFSEYLDWLSRIKLAIFGLSSLDANMVQDVNRGTAQIQHAISQARGVKTMKSLFAEYFTRKIIREMDLDDEDYKWLEFRYREADNLKDKLTQAQVDDIYVKNQVKKPNEIRERDGMAARPESDFIPKPVKGGFGKPTTPPTTV